MYRLFVNDQAGNSVSQSSDSSEYMSSTSSGEDTLSSSSLEDYTFENGDNFSDFEVTQVPIVNLKRLKVSEDCFILELSSLVMNSL